MEFLNISQNEQQLMDFLKDPAAMAMIRHEAKRLMNTDKGSSESDVDDLVQETLLRAYRKIESFRGDSKLTTWIFSILHNNFLNHLRKKRKESSRLRPQDDETFEFPSEDATSEEELETLESMQAIEMTLKSLEGAQLMVILLSLDNLAYKQIADRLGMSENQVRGRLYRARVQIKGLLKERGFGHLIK